MLRLSTGLILAKMFDDILMRRLLLLRCFQLSWILDGFCVVYGLSFEWLLLVILRLLFKHGLLELFFSRSRLCLFCLFLFLKFNCCFPNLPLLTFI